MVVDRDVDVTLVVDVVDNVDKEVEVPTVDVVVFEVVVESVVEVLVVGDVVVEVLLVETVDTVVVAVVTAPPWTRWAYPVCDIPLGIVINPLGRIVLVSPPTQYM